MLQPNDVVNLMGDLSAVTLRALLVEDSPSDADLIRLRLSESRSLRFEVDHATRLSEALSRIESRPDFALVDLSLPDASGTEAVSRLAAAAPDVPLVVMTGNENEDIAVQVIQAGAHGYLGKDNATTALLVVTLRQAIERHRMVRVLEASREAALVASTAKSAFVSAISHEIRTPLTAIIGMSALLAETPLDAEQEQYVEIFRRNGASLLGLLDNVLELSRLESGKTEVESTTFDLAELLGDTVEMFGFGAHSKALVLAFEIDEGVPARIRGDPDRVRQVLANLLGNAIKFTDRGEIVANVGRQDTEDGAFVVFAVSDTGPGIPEDRQAAIFERFEQADPSVHERYGGTGLGLAICKDIVQRMGGCIGVENRPGEGSRFFFTIPLMEAANPQETPHDDRLRNKRILLVDDNGTERRIMARVLAGAGACVVESECLRHALDRLELAQHRGESIECAVLDCRMSGGSGLEIARWLREHPGLVQRTVILLPMDHRAGDVTACRELGAEVLLKPARPRCLIRAASGEDATGRDLGARKAVGERGEGSLRGARLLLAEDSRDIRALITALLRASGCEVVVAPNGAVAVEKFRIMRFDIVLMDLQMPVMDGLQATAEIRRFEAQAHAGRTPILALTAYAFGEQGQACLAAGCDAHVSKPIEKQILLNIIHSFVGAPREPVTVTIDSELADLIPGYLAGRRDDVAVGGQALASGDFARVAGLGHRMRGSGGSYGFAPISEIGSRLENAAKDRDATTVATALEELTTYLESVQIATPSEAEASGGWTADKRGAWG
jgi:signal transduction histidine kinase/HPt (histidine-containing phosphotransfer) domain-containing protein